MTTQPNPATDYVGAVLHDASGHFILQFYEDPALALLTTFGGGLEKGETAIAALIRELREEIGIAFDQSDFRPITTYDKTEADGSTTRCEYLQYEMAVSLADLRLGEGLALVLVDPDSVSDHPLITPAAKHALLSAKTFASALESSAETHVAPTDRTLEPSLLSLPSETSHEYAVRARQLLADFDPSRAELQEFIDDNDAEETVRFNAFYCLQAMLWRKRDYGDYRSNVDAYRSAFSSHPMFAAQLTQYYLSRSSDPANVRSALHYARAAVSALPDVPGVLNLFSETIAQTYDVGYAPGVSPEDLKIAIDNIDRAIVSTNGEYAKYFATRARLLAAHGDFRQAFADIDNAIEIEPSDTLTYPMRIADYQVMRLKIRALEQADVFLSQHNHLERTISEAQLELKTIRTQYLELLGLLVAIMAFVFTSINLTSRFPADQTVSVLVVMSGLILVIFAGFNHQINSTEETRRRTLVPLGLGFLLCAAGVCLLLFVL